MSFPRYPKYKDSGVEWLGEVPEHWGVKKVGHVADLIAGFAFPSKDFEFDPEKGIPLVRGDNVTEGCLRWGEKGRYWPPTLDYDKRFVLEAGDIVVQMDGSKVGKNWALLSESDLPALLVQRVTRIRVSGALPKFVYSLIANEMFVRYVDQAKTDPAVPHITMKNIGDYWITLPPLNEQTAIAVFLDRETAKIDGLVAEQRRLMDLLKEKRQAVISHVVTKGLNPDAPMKPSGIEWLGDVPEHWEVKKLGMMATFKGGAGFPDAYQGETNREIPFFKVGDISNADESGMMISANHTIKSETANELRAFVFPPGTIVFAKVGAALLLRRFRKLYQPSCIDNNMMGMTVRDGVSSDFLLYVLPLLDFELIVNPGAVPSINASQIAGQIVALPKLSEQLSIVDCLNTETAKLDTLTAEAQRAIDLLQERRTALISAAVTGQIDVRNLDPASAA